MLSIPKHIDEMIKVFFNLIRSFEFESENIAMLCDRVLQFL